MKYLVSGIQFAYQKVDLRSKMTRLTCLLCLLAACTEENETRLPVGNLVPKFELEKFSGERVQFADVTTNRVVILNLWASWCRPCREEMPGLESLVKQLDPDRFVLIGISVDEDHFLAEEFLQELNITFDNYHDPLQLIARDVLHNSALPETLLIAPDGRLAHRILGERDWQSHEAVELIQGLAARYQESYE